MQLRTPHDIGYILADARHRRRWSQQELAAKVGVSRQWVSMVENGKTSVGFDLVMSALHALGYSVHVNPQPDVVKIIPSPDSYGRIVQSHSPSQRTQLTRRGKPLKSQRSGSNGS